MELDSENIISINKEILKRFGGDEGDVDVGKIEFILTKVKNTLDIYDKGAVLISEILKKMPFSDGNRRTAFEAVRILFQINGKDIKIKDPQNLIELFKEIRDGSKGIMDLKKWLEAHS